MSTPGHGTDGFQPLMEALYSFYADIKCRADLCVAQEKHAAIHMTKSKMLQVYRLYESQHKTADYLRVAVDSLETWEQSALWDFEGGIWEKIERDVNARMRRHKKLQPVLTRGITWKGNPILVHAYKFEPDPIMKVELVTPDSRMSAPQFSLHAVSDALDCHNFILPEHVASPLAPYTRHEANFLTPVEYLTRTLPEDLYTACCFPSSRLERPS